MVCALSADCFVFGSTGLRPQSNGLSIGQHHQVQQQPCQEELQPQETMEQQETYGSHHAGAVQVKRHTVCAALLLLLQSAAAQHEAQICGTSPDQRATLTSPHKLEMYNAFFYPAALMLLLL